MEPKYSFMSGIERFYLATCAYCGGMQKVGMTTQKDAMWMARRKGWGIRGGHWACPECVQIIKNEQKK